MKAKFSNIVNKNRHELYEVLPLETPYSLFVDVCNACNFKCKFCAIQYANRELPFKKMSMDYDLFCKIIDDLKKFPSPLKMLRLAGNGESLLNKRFAEMVQYAHMSEVTEWIEFVSNASLLTPELNRKLVTAGLNRIRISIEGIDEQAYYEMSGVKIDWNKFVGNIKDLYDHKGNCEIYIKTVDAAVDTEEKRQRFFSIFGDICDKISIEHVIPIWSGYDEIEENFEITATEGLHGHNIREVKICPFPFYSCIIHPDGEVCVCCSDYERKISMGNVGKESLYDIWNGEKYRRFLAGMVENGYRENHIGCSKCEYPRFDAVDDLDTHREELINKFCKKYSY